MAGLYGYRWQKARKVFLAEHPLCVYCQRLGRLSAATVVDHIKPHKGDLVLFWDPLNWQSLCKVCHDSAKRAEELGGQVVGVGADGIPIDGNHHWRQ